MCFDLLTDPQNIDLATNALNSSWYNFRITVLFSYQVYFFLRSFFLEPSTADLHVEVPTLSSAVELNANSNVILIFGETQEHNRDVILAIINAVFNVKSDQKLRYYIAFPSPQKDFTLKVNYDGTDFFFVMPSNSTKCKSILDEWNIDMVYCVIPYADNRQSISENHQFLNPIFELLYAEDLCFKTRFITVPTCIQRHSNEFRCSSGAYDRWKSILKKLFKDWFEKNQINDLGPALEKTIKSAKVLEAAAEQSENPQSELQEVSNLKESLETALKKIPELERRHGTPLEKRSALTEALKYPKEKLYSILTKNLNEILFLELQSNSEFKTYLNGKDLLTVKNMLSNLDKIDVPCYILVGSFLHNICVDSTKSLKTDGNLTMEEIKNDLLALKCSKSKKPKRNLTTEGIEEASTAF